MTVIEISEAQFEALERGSTESLFFNLAIAVTSIAVSFSISLATTTIDSLRVFCVFVVVTVVGYLAGITFGLLWWQFRRSHRSVAREIRSRIPPEGIQEEASDVEVTSA